MKPASAGLIALLATNQFVIWETYTVTLANGATLIWNSGDAPSLLGFSVDLSAITNAGLTSAVGITVSGLNPADTYALTEPPGRTYVAWSGFTGQPWHNNFKVTTSAGDLNLGVPAGNYSTAALAQSNFPAGQTISGHDSYTFWIYDTPVADNLGGLSIVANKV